jgi:adenylate cyclase
MFGRAAQALSAVWKVLRAPLRWLGPEGAGSGAAVYRRTFALLTIAAAVANTTGAAVVFVFAAFVIPGPDIADTAEIVLTNLVAFGIYVMLGLIVGVVWATRRLRPVRDWLREDRSPTKDEQKMVLRAPGRISLINAAVWAVAVPVFTLLNATFSGELAVIVAITTLLGGITTTAVAYLANERLMRAATARALAEDPPDRPSVPGIIARSLLAWALGTGVPVLGLLLVAVFALAEDDVSAEELSKTILGLGGAALAVGLLLAVLAARAASDPVVSVREALQKVERGDLDVEVPIYDGSEVGLLQAGFNRMVEGLRERRKIREAFGAYVDHDVAEHVLKEGVSLEGEEVEVTLMFIDVCDFTAWAEKTPAQEVLERLNGLFEIAVPVIRDHRGHVDKFVGDGLLAVFGAPQRADDHADQAVGAALEIAQAMEEQDSELKIGIGLNSGKVIAGNVGGAGRLEFSVIGDAVNVAARIEAATRETGDTILVSEQTSERMKGTDVELDERPDIELKGREEKVKLFAAGRS